MATPLPGRPNSVTPLPSSVVARPNGAVAAIDPDKSWGRVTWRAALDYQITDRAMVLASHHRGSYSILVDGNPDADPEIMDAFELGAKAELFDRKLRVNAASFHYDYDHMQLHTARPTADEGAKTAVFYWIGNCRAGLLGILFGSFLIKQVVQDLSRELTALSSFVTLSPVPGFRCWLDKGAACTISTLTPAPHWTRPMGPPAPGWPPDWRRG